MSFVVIPVKNIKVKAINKNGPNGTTLPLFFLSSINDIGNARTLPKKIDNAPSNGSSNIPNVNIIFMSPPPSDSFLNNLFPITIMKYMIKNRNNPEHSINIPL